MPVHEFEIPALGMVGRPGRYRGPLRIWAHLRGDVEDAVVHEVDHIEVIGALRDVDLGGRLRDGGQRDAAVDAGIAEWSPAPAIGARFVVVLAREPIARTMGN